VTAVDDAGKLDMLCSIGSDHVIDYTNEDFTRSGETYDAIFDTVGMSPFFRSLRSLTRQGCYLLANPTLAQMILGPWISATSGKKVVQPGPVPFKVSLQTSLTTRILGSVTVRSTRRMGSLG